MKATQLVPTLTPAERAIIDHFASERAAPDARAVVRELVALVHALTGGYIELPRNPYTLDAVRRANYFLTGHAMECGFSESEAMRALEANKGKAPVTLQG